MKISTLICNTEKYFKVIYPFFRLNLLINSSSVGCGVETLVGSSEFDDFGSTLLSYEIKKSIGYRIKTKNAGLFEK